MGVWWGVCGGESGCVCGGKSGIEQCVTGKRCRVCLVGVSSLHVHTFHTEGGCALPSQRI